MSGTGTRMETDIQGYEGNGIKKKHYSDLDSEYQTKRSSNYTIIATILNELINYFISFHRSHV